MSEDNRAESILTRALEWRYPGMWADAQDGVNGKIDRDLVFTDPYTGEAYADSPRKDTVVKLWGRIGNTDKVMCEFYESPDDIEWASDFVRDGVTYKKCKGVDVGQVMVEKWGWKTTSLRGTPPKNSTEELSADEPEEAARVNWGIDNMRRE